MCVGKHQKYTSWPHHQLLLGHTGRVNCLLYPHSESPRYDPAHLVSGGSSHYSHLSCAAFWGGFGSGNSMMRMAFFLYEIMKKRKLQMKFFIFFIYSTGVPPHNKLIIFVRKRTYFPVIPVFVICILPNPIPPHPHWSIWIQYRHTDPSGSNTAQLILPNQ